MKKNTNGSDQTKAPRTMQDAFGIGGSPLLTTAKRRTRLRVIAEFIVCMAFAAAFMTTFVLMATGDKDAVSAISIKEGK